MSAPIGLMITGILVVNNLRDLDNDRFAGKYTLAVLIGERWTRIQYVSLIAVSFLLIPFLIWRSVLPASALLTWLSLPLAWKSTQTVLTQRGRPLNAALAGTGQAALVFSILFFIGTLL
jgi:1,4-dihydroxy-2-naphthoate octaprenyltransferase